MKRSHYLFLLFSLGMLLTTFIYWPGLSGTWLVDDESNIGVFLNDFTPHDTPYLDIIIGNNSGPLGRSVSMATFAANHALGLFSTFSLKVTNLFFHLTNGLLIFALSFYLFRQRNPAPSLTPLTIAAILGTWWLLLPLHTSTVLYIVQRMTQVATLFSLASCLAWVLGRSALQAGLLRKGYLWIFSSLFVFFPLAIFSKESAFCTLAWLLLIEVFFFIPTDTIPQQRRLRGILIALITLSLLVGLILTQTAWIKNGYIGREFSLAERLLTEPRILWTYIRDIFLPNNQQMGLFHDDYLISRSLLSPWTTLIAIIGLLVAIAGSVWLAATRWWGVSFGILFYLAGHLIESTIIALELYFEHRNYLPSLGLLIAAAITVINFWPWYKRWLIAVFVLYLGVLSFSTLQRSHIWGDKNLLLETSALNHPHSLRAWTDYTENLLSTKGGRAALETARQGAHNNPEFASISLLHMVSIYCRLDAAPSDQQLAITSAALPNTAYYYTTPLSIGLQNILENLQAGKCGQANLSILIQSLPLLDQKLHQYYGKHYSQYWLLRFNMAELLLFNHQMDSAVTLLREIWQTVHHADIPTVGLSLAQVLAQMGNIQELHQVLNELEAVTNDAPDYFKEDMKHLREQGKIAPSSK